MAEGTLPLFADSECYLKIQNYFCIYRLRIGQSQDRILFLNCDVAICLMFLQKSSSSLADSNTKTLSAARPVCGLLAAF